MAAIERIERPTSIVEMERRWTAVHKAMAAQGIDALLAQNSSDRLGGYVKWFTDLPAHNYPHNVIFHRDGFIVVVEMGSKDRRDHFDGKQPRNPGVGDWIFSPLFFSVATPTNTTACWVAQEIKHRGYKTVGWLGGRLPHLLRVVEEQVPSSKFVDATDLVDRMKAIKSEAVVALSRRAQCSRYQHGTVWNGPDRLRLRER